MKPTVLLHESKLQIDDNQRRRLSSGAERRLHETHSKIHVPEIFLFESQVGMCSHSKGTFFTLRISQIFQSNVLGTIKNSHSPCIRKLVFKSVKN